MHPPSKSAPSSVAAAPPAIDWDIELAAAAPDAEVVAAPAAIDWDIEVAAELSDGGGGGGGGRDDDGDAAAVVAPPSEIDWDVDISAVELSEEGAEATLGDSDVLAMQRMLGALSCDEAAAAATTATTTTTTGGGGQAAALSWDEPAPAPRRAAERGGAQPPRGPQVRARRGAAADDGVRDAHARGRQARAGGPEQPARQGPDPHALLRALPRQQRGPPPPHAGSAGQAARGRARPSLEARPDAGLAVDHPAQARGPGGDAARAEGLRGGRAQRGVRQPPRERDRADQQRARCHATRDDTARAAVARSNAGAGARLASHARAHRASHGPAGRCTGRSHVSSTAASVAPPEAALGAASSSQRRQHRQQHATRQALRLRPGRHQNERPGAGASPPRADQRRRACSSRRGSRAGCSRDSRVLARARAWERQRRQHEARRAAGALPGAHALPRAGGEPAADRVLRGRAVAGAGRWTDGWMDGWPRARRRCARAESAHRCPRRWPRACRLAGGACAGGGLPGGGGQVHGRGRAGPAAAGRRPGHAVAERARRRAPPAALAVRSRRRQPLRRLPRPAGAAHAPALPLGGDGAAHGGSAAANAALRRRGQRRRGDGGARPSHRRASARARARGELGPCVPARAPCS
eukprot:scaffold1348_cov323-Prasinococcus_capsulatus_cf.AAC.3